MLCLPVSLYLSISLGNYVATYLASCLAIHLVIICSDKMIPSTQVRCNTMLLSILVFENLAFDGIFKKRPRAKVVTQVLCQVNRLCEAYFSDFAPKPAFSVSLRQSKAIWSCWVTFISLKELLLFTITWLEIAVGFHRKEYEFTIKESKFYAFLVTMQDYT